MIDDTAERYLFYQLCNIYDLGEARSISRLLAELISGAPPENWHDLADLWLLRMAKNEPIQYIVGYTWFYGLKIKVDQRVLIPRPETEELVDMVVQDYRNNLIINQPQILDVGTGSGCIALAIKKNISRADVHAIDVSSDAQIVAQANASVYGLDIDFTRSDILIDTMSRTFDVIISNPPYVSDEEFGRLSSQVREYEPRQALMPDSEDPLIFYRKLAEFGKTNLNTNGTMYLELNEFRAYEIRALFIDAGYDTDLRKDMQGKWRMLKAGLIR